MINGISLSKLRNTEFAQFITDTLALVQRNDPAALQVQPAYDALKAASDQLNQLLNPQKGSALTAQIEAADDRRDAAVSGLNAVVSGYTLHFDEATRNAALALQRNLAQYGSAGLARENYQSETAGINSLLADWSTKAELTAAVTTLGLKTWQDELTQANQAFNDLYVNRIEEASTVNPASARSERVTIMPLYYELRDLIDAYFTINKGADPYGATVNQLNELIGKYNDLLAGRKPDGSTATAEQPVS